MAEETSTLNRHDLEAKIVKRCWEDEAFRKEFTAGPAGSFVKYLGVSAASLPTIIVHQEAPRSWDIVLPAKPANANELSGEDLEKVAGGSAVTPSVFLIATAVVAVGSAAAGVVRRAPGGW
jgi:hypothetical protein